MFTIDVVEEDKYNELLIKNGDVYTPLTQAPKYSFNNIYLLIKTNNREIGILSISLRIKFKGIFKYARINNGPIILKKNVNKNYLIKSIFNYLKKRGYRLILFAPHPEIKSRDIKNIKFLFKLPLNKSGTILLNLNKPIEELRSCLKQKWRNTLNKSLKFTKVKKLTDSQDITEILSKYQEFANKNKFTPIDINRCEKWAIEKNDLINLEIYQAFELNTEFLGSIGIISFAKTSFYLFGFSNKRGRKIHANSALLWQAIKDSKDNKNEIFDLGGLNESTPLGIRKFKEGLGGERISNIGEFLKII